MADDVSTVREALLAQRTINWALTAEDNLAIDTSVRAAIMRLNNAAGKSLDFQNPSYLDLAATAAWYIWEERWPEFTESYRQELVLLRLKEAHGCGQDNV